MTVADLTLFGTFALELAEVRLWHFSVEPVAGCPGQLSEVNRTWRSSLIQVEHARVGLP
jgi:hypothetical protein